MGGDELRPLKSCFLCYSDYSCFKGPGRQLHLPGLRTRAPEAKQLGLSPSPRALDGADPPVPLPFSSRCPAVT